MSYFALLVVVEADNAALAHDVDQSHGFAARLISASDPWPVRPSDTPGPNGDPDFDDTARLLYQHPDFDERIPPAQWP